MNFAFGDTAVSYTHLRAHEKQSPIQLAHSPEDIQEFVDVLDA